MNPKTKFKQIEIGKITKGNETEKDKSILGFIEDHKGSLSFIGILFAVIIYFSNFSKEYFNNRLIQNNFGWAIIITYALIIFILVFLINKSLTDEYDSYATILTILLFFIALLFYSYIGNKFYFQVNNLLNLIELIVPIGMAIYLFPKILNYIEKQKLSVKIFTTFIAMISFVFINYAEGYVGKVTWIIALRLFHQNIILTSTFWNSIYVSLKLWLILLSAVLLLKYLPILGKKLISAIKKGINNLKEWNEKRKTIQTN